MIIFCLVKNVNINLMNYKKQKNTKAPLTYQLVYSDYQTSICQH